MSLHGIPGMCERKAVIGPARRGDRTIIICRRSQRDCSWVHRPRPLRHWRRALISLVTSTIFFHANRVLAQDLELSPTRPTIANSAAIQGTNVLQVESGYDAYPGSQQTVGSLLSYVPRKRLRLDFGWSAFSHEENEGEHANGIGTIQLGGKMVFIEEKYHHGAPGVGLQYEAELPTASASALQGFGQQLILLVNHHYGRNGILDVIVNGSLVQSDCHTRRGCRYGGQQSFGVSYHMRERTRLYAEVFGQNNAQSNTPPGTYCFGGFYHRFGDSFGIDGGMRFGVTRQSARIGPTIAFVFGRRLRRDYSQGTRQP